MSKSDIKFYFQGDNARENANLFSNFCEKAFNCKPEESISKINQNHQTSKADPCSIAAIVLGLYLLLYLHQ